MFGVTILGNNSALPAWDRHPTAQIVTLNEQLFLIDCGEGTQFQIARFKVRWARLRHIFISHLHGDHYFGLAGLLTSMGLLGRQAQLDVFGPPGLEEILTLQFKLANNHLRYPLHFHTMPEAGGQLIAEAKYEVRCFPVKHRVPCWGFLFCERKNPRKLLRENLDLYGIPSSSYAALQQGADYQDAGGITIANEILTVAAPPPRSYAFCADTLYDESLVEIVQGVSLLYHETTYLHDMKHQANERFHTTALEAGKLASMANPKKLLIGHFSSKYEHLEPFAEEAKKLFANTHLAIEGVTHLV